MKVTIIKNTGDRTGCALLEPADAVVLQHVTSVTVSESQI